jgi:uncharacterized membrane protein YciS (DUF1049 family)
MWRLVLAVLVTVALVAFGMANTHQVELSVVVGPPVKFRLIVLVALAYAAGIVTAWFREMLGRVARQAERRRLQARLKATAVTAPEGGE